MDESSEFIRVFLPYYLEMQPCGRYRIANWHGLPLGISASEATEQPVPLLNVRITLNAVSKLSAYQCRDPKKIFLYAEDRIPSAGSKSWLGYQARLCVLSRLPSFDVSADSGHVGAERAREANLQGLSRYLEEREFVRAWLSEMGKEVEHG